MSSRRIVRTVTIILTGGCLLQFVGCASGLVPVVLSFVESALFTSLLGGIG